jgi:hypothetical protein
VDYEPLSKKLNVELLKITFQLIWIGLYNLCDVCVDRIWCEIPSNLHNCFSLACCSCIHACALHNVSCSHRMYLKSVHWAFKRKPNASYCLTGCEV